MSIFIFFAFRLSAQTGRSNLDFVENRGQWNGAIKYRAEMSAGAFYLQQKGFTVLLHDTSDMRRIQAILHGSPGAGNAYVPAEGSTGGGKAGSKTTAASRSVSAASVAPIKEAPVEGGSGSGSGAGLSGSSGYVLNKDLLLHSHSYSVSFENASEQAIIVPEKALPSFNNYFIGDRSHWASGVKIYEGVVYKDLYPGIDLHYYSDGGFLKYDLVVHPGADPSQIVLKYDGQEKLSIKKKQLLVRTSVSTVTELEPRSYQLDEKGRTDVSCNYSIRDGNKVSFVLGNRDPNATLVIDPTEVFCTFTGSKSDNWGYTATYDDAGNLYAGGIAINYSDHSGGLFRDRVTTGAFQSTFQGGDGSEGTVRFNDGSVAFLYDFDVAIMKFNSNGSTAVYATYLGGAGDEQPHSMVCDPSGNLIVTGRTTSANFPPTAFSAPNVSGKGFDIFIAKLSADGTNLIGSLKIGGDGSDGVNYSPKYVNQPLGGTQELRLNYGDDGRGEVILDATNNIYVVSCTQSSNFPVTAGAFQLTSGGGQDGVIIKASPDANAVIASSYIGGSASDAAFSIALNPINNNIYVSGGTLSTDLKGVGSGPVYQSAKKGGVDGFVSIIGNNGTNLSLLKTTYFGTDGTDMIYGIQFDKEGHPYIMGTTSSVITPVNSPFNQSFGQATGKQFITKLQTDLSAVAYSANFGPDGLSAPNISPTAFLVDRCENVYVSGWGGGIDPGDGYSNSTTNGLKTTSDAIKTSTDGADFYFFVLQKNATSQLYGSFFGQPGGALGDHVDGGTSRFDKQGVIYQSVCANCDGPDNIFPVTPSVWARHNGALAFGGCNEAAVKIAFNFSGVAAGLKLSLQGRGDSLGCVPLDVIFQDTVRNAKSYIWNFGDAGSVDTATTGYAVSHTYYSTGVYRVMLVAIDSNSCNVADTVYRNITVRDNRATLNFSYAKTGLCQEFYYLFDNTSSYTGSAPPFTSTSFIWDFGDGSIQQSAGLGMTPHSFQGPGTYNVKLILVDTNYCNYPDTLVRAVPVAQNVKALFETPAVGCAPYYAVFNNTSTAGETYLWDFGDGSTSTDAVPAPHLYPTAGPYTITLTATNQNTCNKVDVFSTTITLQVRPTAGFTFSPNPPVANTPTVFTSLSSADVIRYQWLFGDGGSTAKSTDDTVMHQYNRTGSFQACLIVYNQSGCTDTACMPVSALIDPLLDVPNAFTPGRFGQNGVVKVVGFGITQLSFRIYNRWGQLVFQSNDRNVGWDGTYKGVLQPMDVYAYTLEAGYFDGTHVSKKGDITLIR